MHASCEWAYLGRPRGACVARARRVRDVEVHGGCPRQLMKAHLDLRAAGAGPRLRDLFPDFDDEAWRRRFDVPLVGGVRVPTSSFGETDLS